jgi:hypothetical protein
MSFSRSGIIVFITLSVFLTANCSYFNRIMSRKNLVDGSIAYKERKFEKAEELFRSAAARDPNGETLEGRTAQLFLARTIHSQYIGDRKRTDLAEEAIAEYRKMLSIDPNEQSSYKAVASLLDNLNRSDEWNAWVTERANNESILPQHRADALISLIARQNTCANEITDTEKTRKTVQRDGKDVYEYVKPENEADLKRLQECVARGTELVDKAIGLETEEVKGAASLDLQSMSDAELNAKRDVLRVFESVRSYKASILVQASRLAEMEGRSDDAKRLRDESDKARESFTELSEINRKIQAELEARVAAAAAEAEKEAEKPGGGN